jgi:hypothetical protein
MTPNKAKTPTAITIGRMYVESIFISKEIKIIK